MGNIQNVLLLLLLFMTWSCKEQTQKKDESIAFVEKDSIDTIDSSVDQKDISIIQVQKNEIVTNEQKSQVPKPTQKPGDTKIKVSQNNNIDKTNTTTDAERPSIKPISEPVREIPSNDQIIKDETKVSTTKSVDHQLFNQQLKKYVQSGKVNYKAWKKDMTGLNDYLKDISEAQNIEKWSYEEKLVFWINTYNAFTVKLVLDHYPIKSIKDINKGKPWDERFIQIGHTFYSLNDIENEIIRKKFGEPRIHFALNCAAKSCPILVNKAFTKENLNTLLESNTKSFMNGTLNTITKDKVELSSIFDWYGSDFDDLIGFVTKYAIVKPNPNAKISFKTYDWSLNE